MLTKFKNFENNISIVKSNAKDIFWPKNLTI